jgi:hypothetical protein
MARVHNPRRFERNGLEDGWLRPITYGAPQEDSKPRLRTTMTRSETRFLIFLWGIGLPQTRLGWSTLEDARTAAAGFPAERFAGIYDQKTQAWYA